MAEPASDVNRRTSVLFCKSKSVSPPKSAKNTETQPTSPQLGTKTFLSVVLPRLETLLQPRKRSRSTCGDSEVEEGSPGKRLDTGRCHALLFAGLRAQVWGVLPAVVFQFTVHSSLNFQLRRQTVYLFSEKP